MPHNPLHNPTALTSHQSPFNLMRFNKCINVLMYKCCLTTSVFIARWLWVIWRRALCKFRPRQFFSFPEAKTSIEEREAGTTDCAWQIDSATNSVEIDWKIAWKHPAWDLWRKEDTSHEEKLEDTRGRRRERDRESEEFSFLSHFRFKVNYHQYLRENMSMFNTPVNNIMCSFLW